MEIYRQVEEVPAASGPVVATIGNFDGVHCGHRWVIAEVIARARALGGRSLAITFDPHPARVLRPEMKLALITPLERKLELLAETGIDATLVLPFTEELRRMSAREFAGGILRDGLRVAEVHEGESFRFGHNAEAGVDGPAGLESLGKEMGFAVRVYKPRMLRGGPISSSRIRGLIAAGEVGQARALLGRAFSVESTPASGRGFGTKYAVPTINLAAYGELLPGHGVYITELRVGDEAFDGVTNVGNRPTFGEDSFAVETHLLNFHPIALEETTPLRLTFLKRLRAEQRFASPEALKGQILRDVGRARRYHELRRVLC
jgi:riboflavin kinase / FMN adenylyltransferase